MPLIRRMTLKLFDPMAVTDDEIEPMQRTSAESGRAAHSKSTPTPSARKNRKETC